jgi:Ca-activated chloride channel family protein
MGGTLPHADMVRTEEFINYFDYDYANPSGDEPFAINTEVCNAPWNPENKLVRVALQGKKLDFDKLEPANLVFLIDASGSMEDENKLPLLIKSLKILLNNLSSKDKISIVAYAGAAGVVLPPTSASEKDKILKALENVKAGGSTAGGEGLLLAYKMAKDGFIENGNNRVILATDGDFNVGVSSTAELVRLLEEKKKDKIYLTICGFGMGNYKDSRMKKMASTADGNYYFIDNITEATRIFGKEIRATLFTIAKDVKIQIEFNPKIVQAYRLIGYESRLLKNEDFNDDTKDAGELGAGHRVTAIYEIIPVGVKSNFVKSVDDLKYASKTANNGNANELMTVKLRYKKPNSDTSLLITKEVKDADVNIEKASENMRFATSVAAFAAILRRSEFKQNTNYEQVLQLANGAKGKDEEGYRAEFVKLVKIAQELDKK